MRFFISLSIFLFSLTAHAVAPIIDANLFYYSDTLTYNSKSSTYSRTMYDAMLGMPLSKKGNWIIGWNYDNMTFTDSPNGTATTVTVTDMGPKVLYYLDKNLTWMIGITYDLITTGHYATSGSATTELRGSALKAEAGYTPMMWDNVFIGAKINYYKATFKEEIVNDSSLTHVSDSRSAIYPTFSFTFRF